jgi:hypothetical protein
MNTCEIGMPDVGHDIRTLRDDELGAVTGGAGRPASQTVTMLDYEGTPVVTYSVSGSWDRR